MDKKKAGIYIHIPFCVKKCNYCDFLSGPCGKSDRASYLDALKWEIRERAAKVGEKYQISTIYFGGGTPSLLDTTEVEEVFDAIKEAFSLKLVSGELYNSCDGEVNEKVTEITIEVNPGTVDFNKLEAYRRLGFNRVSIGIQSANDEELKLLGRIHTFGEGVTAFDNARKAGFENISVDIISALPNQSLKDYNDNLDKILELEPNHISAYSLIIEEGTAFYDLYGEKGKRRLELPSEELDRQMYALTKEKLKTKGYERYEISNYSKAGYESKHNSSYWNGTDYLGFGLGAASLLEGIRYSNCRELKEYINDPLGTISVDEVLSEKDKMSEFMILGLRMCKGVSKMDFKRRFGKDLTEVFGKEIAQLIEYKLMESDNDRLWLTDYGLDISNSVFEKFL